MIKLVEKIKNILKGAKTQTYKETKEKYANDSIGRLEKGAVYAPAAIATGMAAYPQSEDNPIYTNLGIPGHKLAEDFLNNVSQTLHLTDASTTINLPPIAPYIAGAILCAGISNTKHNLEKKIRMYDKIEERIADQIIKELESVPSTDFLSAQNIYDNVNDDCKKTSKKGWIFKSDEENLAKFVEEHPEMYKNFTNEVLSALKAPESVNNEDINRIVKRIEPYIKQKGKLNSLYSKFYDNVEDCNKMKVSLTAELNASKGAAEKAYEEKSGLEAKISELKTQLKDLELKNKTLADKLIITAQKTTAVSSDKNTVGTDEKISKKLNYNNATGNDLYKANYQNFETVGDTLKAMGFK